MRRAGSLGIAALAGALPLLGCATDLGPLTSGQIGCPPSQIFISDEVAGFGRPRTWTAQCSADGASYYCSAHGGGQGTPLQVSCSRAGGPTPGCHYDTQCKGDRICQTGTCTAP